MQAFEFYRLKITLHIPKQFLLRLSLFVAVISAAYVAGTFFGDKFSTLKEQQEGKPADKNNVSVNFCIYTPANSFKLNTTPSKLSTCRLFFAAQSKFYEISQNLRDNLQYKTEKEIPLPPLSERILFATFITHLYSSPDDYPLAA